MKFHENSPMLLKLGLKAAQKISFNRFNGARQFACTLTSIFQIGNYVALLYDIVYIQDQMRKIIELLSVVNIWLIFIKSTTPTLRYFVKIGSFMIKIL